MMIYFHMTIQTVIMWLGDFSTSFIGQMYIVSNDVKSAVLLDYNIFSNDSKKLTAHKWQKWKSTSSHVTAMKFIEKKRLV